MFSLVSMFITLQSFGTLPFEPPPDRPPPPSREARPGSGREGREGRDGDRGPRMKPKADGPMARAPRLQALFRRIDRNGDGLIDTREFAAAAPRLLGNRAGNAPRGPMPPMGAPALRMDQGFGPSRMMACPCCRGRMGGPPAQMRMRMRGPMPAPMWGRGPLMHREMRERMGPPARPDGPPPREMRRGPREGRDEGPPPRDERPRRRFQERSDAFDDFGDEGFAVAPEPMGPFDRMGPDDEPGPYDFERDFDDPDD